LGKREFVRFTEAQEGREPGRGGGRMRAKWGDERKSPGGKVHFQNEDQKNYYFGIREKSGSFKVGSGIRDD